MFSVLLLFPLRAEEEERVRKTWPGFRRGSVVIFIVGTETLSTGGSAIDQEKKFNEEVKLLTLIGSAQVFPNYPATFVPDYKAKNRSGIAAGAEYGITDSIGLGASVLNLDLGYTGTNIVSIPGRNYVSPIPREGKIMNGNSLLVGGYYHFMKDRNLDPFVSAKIGAGSFSSSIHSSAFEEFNKYPVYGYKGRAAVFSVSGGLNFYLNKNSGIRIEAAGYHFEMNSDTYSKRVLDVFQFQAGFFTNLQKYAEEETPK